VTLRSGSLAFEPLRKGIEINPAFPRVEQLAKGIFKESVAERSRTMNDGELRAYFGNRETRFRKRVDEAQSHIDMRASLRERSDATQRELPIERYVGPRRRLGTQDRVVFPFLKDDSTAVVHHARGLANRPDRVARVHQKESSDDGVDRCAEGDLLERLRDKSDSIETLLDGPAPRFVNDLRIFVRADNLTAGTDALRNEQRNVGDPSPEHEDAHPRRNARACKQLLG
jgi:hypothetical protein